MVLNPFTPKQAEESAEAFFLTATTPPTIPELLADSRARFGPKTAYQKKEGGEWRRLTFNEAWDQANEFAAGLIALGLEKGERVAIVCENGIPWIVAYYGLSLAGAVGVPLYLELKRTELEDLIERSGAKFVIVSERVMERMDGHFPGVVDRVIIVGGTETHTGGRSGLMRRVAPAVLPFDQVALQANDQSRAALTERRPAPEDLASIVFTSGTTGGMKGVMLTHRNFTSNIESIRRTLDFDEKERIVLVLPLHHALPFIILLAGFAFGGELTFENDLLRVRDRLQEVKPTLFLGVPAIFEQIYRAVVRRAEAEDRLELFERGLRAVDAIKRRTGVNLGRSRFLFREVSQTLGGHLRFLLSGGAPLKPEVARNFLRLGLPLIQGWGLSEATAGVAAQRWSARRFLFSNYYEEHLGTVGPPLDGVEVKLIDVPEKEIYVHLHGEGELVVRGPNVFAGYWQAPEETAAAMLGDWLRTGDLGRIDEEGNIWITGRSKYVIVLDSGEKVVPDELEDRLSESDLITDICVVARHARGKAQVGAIIYPNLEGVQKRLSEQGKELSAPAVLEVVQKELDAFAKELAPYKRVTDLTLTDTPLPKTALLKIARGHISESHSFDLERWRKMAVDEPVLPDGESQAAQNAAPEAEPAE